MIRLEVFAIIVLLTFPFGFYRVHTRKMSVRWFAAIHVPVPLIFLTRFEAHLSYAFIPFSVLAFALGQYLGGKAGNWWSGRRDGTTRLEPSASEQIGEQQADLTAAGRQPEVEAGAQADEAVEQSGVGRPSGPGIVDLTESSERGVVSGRRIGETGRSGHHGDQLGPGDLVIGAEGARTGADSDPFRDAHGHVAPRV